MQTSLLCNNYSAIGISPPQFLQSALDDWIATNSNQSTCGNSMSEVVDGAPYQARIVNHVNPSTGQIRCIEWRIVLVLGLNTSRQSDVLNCIFRLRYTNYFVLYSQGYQFFCGGTRCFTQRSFVIETPIILPIPLDYFSRIGVIRDGTQLPQFVMVQGERNNIIS